METVYEVEENMGYSPLLICCSAMENVCEVEGKKLPLFRVSCSVMGVVEQMGMKCRNFPLQNRNLPT